MGGKNRSIEATRGIKKTRERLLNDEVKFLFKLHLYINFRSPGCDQPGIKKMSEAVNPKAYPLADAEVRKMMIESKNKRACEHRQYEINPKLFLCS